jgi:hypothetical protein
VLTDKCIESEGISGYGNHGYGMAHTADGGVRTAHRVAWEAVNGPIPEDMCVLHKCDNRKCVNPAHLFLGTRADNNKDMWEKDRGWSPFNSGVGMTTNEAVVKEIRAAPKDVPNRHLAKVFGISPTHVGRIRRNLVWKHVR